jgi:hypothetical protein
MAGQRNTTTDHQTIRRWVEERGGRPASVKSTAGADDVGVLRIDFPGYSGEQSLEPISWEALFEKVDEKQLAFVYQDETSSGEESRFSKLVGRDTAEGGRASEQTRSAQQSGGRQQVEAQGQEQPPMGQAVQPILEDLPQQIAETVRQQIEEAVPLILEQCAQQVNQALESIGPQGQERQQTGGQDADAPGE